MHNWGEPEPHTGGSRGPLDVRLSCNPKKHREFTTVTSTNSFVHVPPRADYFLHMLPPAMSVNVPETDEAKQDRLRKRRE